MSKEATGQFGATLGSGEYWSRINRSTIFASLMDADTNYRAALGQLGTRAGEAIEEIYEDLCLLGSRIRYLPSSNRNALAKQVEGLYDICRMAGTSPRHSDDCIQGLNLSTMSPWTRSFRDERGIENADYERLLRENLRSIADQLERDLDNAIRENDYITDETADKLKAVVSELDHCGVSTGSLNSKIDKLAWFVGGDPAKIKELQRALNDLGVGQHLEEDGVYGENTKTAVDKFIGKLSDFLTDPDKLRSFGLATDALFAALDTLLGPQSQLFEMHIAFERIRRDLQRVIWKFGIKYFLQPRGYTVAALFLEHSLKQSPYDLHFSQSHWVTQKVMRSTGLRRACEKLKEKIQEHPDTFTLAGTVDIDFQSSGDTDLYYGIGKCPLKYSCERTPSSARIKFTIEDKYNFDYIRSVEGDAESFIRLNVGLGNLANDAGLFSQADGVLSVYNIYITFETTIELD